MLVQGDALRRQRSELSRNSRAFGPASSQESHPTAPDSLTSPLAALSLTRTAPAVSFKCHSMNHDSTRGNAKGVDYSNNTGGPSLSHLAGPNYSFMGSEKQIEVNASSDYRKSFLQDGSQSRSNIYQRAMRPSVSRGSTSLCTSMDTWEQNQRPFSGIEVPTGYQYSLRSRSYSMQSNNTDIHRVVKSKDALKPPVGEGVCTQRTINAAGQPRKVVVPMGVGLKDSSPRRQRSISPIRFPGNHG